MCRFEVRMIFVCCLGVMLFSLCFSLKWLVGLIVVIWIVISGL